MSAQCLILKKYVLRVAIELPCRFRHTPLRPFREFLQGDGRIRAFQCYSYARNMKKGKIEFGVKLQVKEFHRCSIGDIGTELGVGTAVILIISGLIHGGMNV